MVFHQSIVALNLTSGESYRHNDIIKQAGTRNHQEIIFIRKKIYVLLNIVFKLNKKGKFTIHYKIYLKGIVILFRVQGIHKNVRVKLISW